MTELNAMDIVASIFFFTAGAIYFYNYFKCRKMCNQIAKMKHIYYGFVYMVAAFALIFIRGYHEVSLVLVSCAVLFNAIEEAGNARYTS